MKNEKQEPLTKQEIEDAKHRAEDMAREIATDVAKMFYRNKWGWAGEIPSARGIEITFLTLIHSIKAEEYAGIDQCACVSSGRLQFRITKYRSCVHSVVEVVPLWRRISR